LTGPTDPPVFDPDAAAPMPPEPAPDTCPHCGAALRSPGSYRKEDDYAVCSHCGHVLIIMENGQPRLPSFDEAIEAEADPRVRFMIENSKPGWMRGEVGPEESGP
jgi:DNA-directed RNA polymerase subunit RPC12/RpoP